MDRHGETSIPPYNSVAGGITTLFWRKKAKINLHQNFLIYGIIFIRYHLLYLYDSMYCIYILCIIFIWYHVLYLYDSIYDIVYYIYMISCIVFIWQHVLYLYDIVYYIYMISCIVLIRYHVLYLLTGINVVNITDFII